MKVVLQKGDKIFMKYLILVFISLLFFGCRYDAYKYAKKMGSYDFPSPVINTYLASPKGETLLSYDTLMASMLKISNSNGQLNKKFWVVFRWEIPEDAISTVKKNLSPFKRRKTSVLINFLVNELSFEFTNGNVSTTWNGADNWSILHKQHKIPVEDFVGDVFGLSGSLSAKQLIELENLSKDPNGKLTVTGEYTYWRMALKEDKTGEVHRKDAWMLSYPEKITLEFE